MTKLIAKYSPVRLDNSVDNLIPEIWANEALMQLEANLVMANLVHTDFKNEIASFGDTVNADRPSAFVSKTKKDSDSVTVQDAVSTKIPVKLDQHHHVSFMIKDGQESKAFRDLVTEFITPAVQALALGLDQSIFGEAYNFLGTRIGQYSVDPTKSSITRLRAAMSNNLAPLNGRNLVVSPNIGATLLDIADFSSAEKVGDAGTAIRTGSIGQRLGFNIIESQGAPSVPTGVNDVLTGTVNKVAGYPVGATVIDVDTMTVPVAGSWLTIEGDMTPLKIASATATELTLVSGLKYAITDGAVVTVYEPALINLVAGYDSGLYTDVAINDLTLAPAVGQMISQGSYYYGAKTGTTATSLLLSTTNKATMANDAVLGIGPAGDYGFAFNREAIALVTRPLAVPRAGTGARSAVMNYNGLSMRVTITYDGTKQGHLVTLDFLTGVKTLDTRLGALLIA